MKNYIQQFVADHDFQLSNLRWLKYIPRTESGNVDEILKKGSLKNKVAIVTGASSGIGKAIAKELALQGANVILASRNKSKLNQLMNDINNNGGLAVSFATDVTKEEDCKSLIEGTIKAFGKIDILVNNAGISMRANFNKTSIDVIKKVMDTNFWGTVYCTKYALPYIIEQKGSIIGISSICGVTPLPGRTGYAASKHAMDGFLESLRLENLNNGLHVMLVHPGFTTSNIRNVALNKDGLPQVETPLEEDKLMPAEQVAKEVLSGIIQKKKNITLTTEGRLITWIYRQMPSLAELLIHREMRKEVNAPF